MKKYNFETSKAFVNTCNILPTQSGPLDGLTFAVKDNIDIAIFKTSYGSKSWLELHAPAVNHAICVEQLLNAGADLEIQAVLKETIARLNKNIYSKDYLRKCRNLPKGEICFVSQQCQSSHR